MGNGGQETEIIANYQLPITNYQLPITNYQLPITLTKVDHWQILVYMFSRYQALLGNACRSSSA
jgi:hypothetical protein